MDPQQTKRLDKTPAECATPRVMDAEAELDALDPVLKQHTLDIPYAHQGMQAIAP